MPHTGPGRGYGKGRRRARPVDRADPHGPAGMRNTDTSRPMRRLSAGLYGTYGKNLKNGARRPMAVREPRSAGGFRCAERAR